MTFRIEHLVSAHGPTLAISGEIAAGRQSELRELLHVDPARPITIDLAGVTRVDLDGVALLHQCELQGAALLNVPGYVRARIADLPQPSTTLGDPE